MSRFLDMTSAPAEYANDPDFAPSETLVTAPSRATLPRARSYSEPKDRFRFFQYMLLLYVFFYCSRINELISGMRFALVLLPIPLIRFFMSARTKANRKSTRL